MKAISHIMSNQLRHGGNYAPLSTAGLAFIRSFLRTIRKKSKQLDWAKNEAWNDDEYLMELMTHVIMDRASGEQNRWRPCVVVPQDAGRSAVSQNDSRQGYATH